MKIRRMRRGFLAMLLSAALLLSTVLPAAAAEVAEETAIGEHSTEATPPETTLPTETTQPPEATLPAETTQPPETTLPVETTKPPETALPSETTQPTEAVQPETEPAIAPETTLPAQEAQPETQPEEADPDKETAAATEPAVLAGMPCSIAYVNSLEFPAGELALRGTVVLAQGEKIVLQDASGGIRLLFSQPPTLCPGDRLEVIGSFDGVFSVTAFEYLEPGQLPEPKETTLLEAPDALRILVRQAVLEGSALTQDGFSVKLSARLPESASGTVDAYGVLLDGVFYADSVVPVQTQEAPEDWEWNLYFGLLHAHTGASDGVGTVEEAFAHAYEGENLDFFAITDHSHSFDNAAGGSIATDGTTVSEEWKAGKAAAAAVTDDTFVGIFGYEMSWPPDRALGHIGTFHTPGWESWDQGTPDNPADDRVKTLTDYYAVLADQPGAIGQFNHPGHSYGNFRGFRDYSPEYDQALHLLEVGSGDEGRDYDAYTQALDAGWHLAPTNNQNNKEGHWGDASAVRTVILAKELTEAALYDAMRSHRVYATEDGDLRIFYRVNGAVQGSILGPQEKLTAQIILNDPTDSAIGTVEVIADGGTVVCSRYVSDPAGEVVLELPQGYAYYYLRVTQPDQDIAVTAPVWVEDYADMGIQSFTASSEQPEAGEEVSLTLELFNKEPVDFVLETLEFFCNGERFHVDGQPGTLQGTGSLSCSLPFSREEPGVAAITVKVTGTVAGQRRDYEKTLTLRCQAKPEEVKYCTIGEIRSGAPGQTYRFKGYVTAGNNNPGNTFPDTLYLQDDTGGIAVTGVELGGMEIGQPMEVCGVLRRVDGNLQIEQTDCTALQETFYRYVPRTMAHETAMDYPAHGGELLQVQGTVVSVMTKGSGVSRFTLKDLRGDLATVVIEEGIASGSSGKNELASQVKKGRTVRAMGLLHIDEYGQTVLRVRNCDEVVYVPPKADPTNPKTGDWLRLLP